MLQLLYGYHWLCSPSLPAPKKSICSWGWILGLQLEEECMEEPNHLDVDLETRIPVINKVDGTLLVGEDAPRRAELEMWLQGHPEFAVDPRFLAVSGSSIQQNLKVIPLIFELCEREEACHIMSLFLHLQNGSSSTCQSSYFTEL